MKKIKSHNLAIAQLSDALLQEMYALFAQYYRNTDFATFYDDLAEKDHVFMFRDKLTRQLLGFSTIYKKCEKVPKLGKVTYIFSGDTVMDRKIWGSRILQVSFFFYILKSKFKSPLRPVYWMLMSKGFKTYMMMRRNFQTSYPSRAEKMPRRVALIRDYFYRRKFGAAYRPHDGLIIYPEQKDAVKDGYACPDANDLDNLDIQFFLKLNPEYPRGHELACIAEVRFQDFPRHLFKYIVKPVWSLTARLRPGRSRWVKST